jgi:carboxylate-amine ligase
MRITDACSRLDDALSIAAIYRCLLSMLWRLKGNNQRWRLYADMLVAENRWRAQRYGIDEGLVDFGKGEIVPYARLLDELIELTRPEAARFGCAGAVEHARTIVARGTSAHRQVSVYQEALARGAGKEDALCAVVDWLITETALGL